MWSSGEEEDDLYLGIIPFYEYGDELDWCEDVLFPDARPSGHKYPKKPLSEYTMAERETISKACRVAGKESPWDYNRRTRAAKLNGKETKMEYQARKAAEPAKKAAKELEAEIPVPEKPKHKLVLNLQQQRNAAGMSQKDAARAINEKQKVIQDWESGRVKPKGPKFGKLKNIYKRKIAQAERKK